MKTEFILQPDGAYELRLIMKAEDIKEVYNSSYTTENICRKVAEKFADEYVSKNFNELSKLIDLDTLKVLATRQIVKQSLQD